MKVENLRKDLKNIGQWYYKLIIICSSDKTVDFSLFIDQPFEEVNVNLDLSEALLSYSKEQYPLVINDLFVRFFSDRTKVYLLRHINILFDPQLQINPVRLLENLSKKYKLVVEWPGVYKDKKLIYAEFGHPEYFVCSDYEGKVYCF